MPRKRTRRPPPENYNLRSLKIWPSIQAIRHPPTLRARLISLLTNSDPPPKLYVRKGHAVLIDIWANELSEAVNLSVRVEDGVKRVTLGVGVVAVPGDGDDLTAREIKETIIRRLQNLADNLGLMARGEQVPEADRRAAMHAARLFLYERDKVYRSAVNRTPLTELPPKPDLAAAQRAVQYHANRLKGMEMADWRKRLKELLGVKLPKTKLGKLGKAKLRKP